MSFFAWRFLWRAPVRYALFWAVVGAVAWGLAFVTPYSDWPLVADTIAAAIRGNLEGIARQDFAFGLASGIFQIAGALAAAFLLCHVILVRLALLSARMRVGRAEDEPGFAAGFDTISDLLKRNGLVGHAWREFSETIVRQDNAIHITMRPQAFINTAEARDHLFGLKMMPAIPGFFVGLGLLLTFIGLVIALNKAAGTVTASEADQMVGSLNQLLEAATFKFSTSIAGLGASLALSIIFRAYQIWIERGFSLLCRAIDDRTTFHPGPQVTLESRNILAEQRDQLKEINSDRFFTKLGESFGTSVEAAVTNAIAPMTDRLDGAMREFQTTSQGGVEKMLQGFLQRLQAGAGVELGQIAQTLDGTRRALEGVQANLSGSGADFQRRMTEASEALTRVVEEASQKLGGSASGVAGAVESAMAGVAEKLEAQMAGFGTALSGLQDAVAEQTEEGARRSREAGEAAAAASRRTAEEVAGLASTVSRETLDALKSGVGEVVESLRRDITGLSETLARVNASFGDHTRQIETVTTRSRETADAFGRVAGDVRSASVPLLAQGERISGATDRMAASVSASVAALSGLQQAASSTAEELSRHLAQIASVWDQYEQRFKSVDEDLGRAAERFHEEVGRHQEMITKFVEGIDRHTGQILTKLNSGVASLDDNVGELNETLDDFLKRFGRAEAAE